MDQFLMLLEVLVMEMGCRLIEDQNIFSGNN